MPTLQQSKTIRGKEYAVSATLDPDNNTLSISATDPTDLTEHSLHIKLDEPVAEESAGFEIAQIISNLDIENGGLGIRRV